MLSIVVAGCGRTGSACARLIADQGHLGSLWLADRVASRATDLARELGSVVAGCLPVSPSGRVEVPVGESDRGLFVSFQPAGLQLASAVGAVSHGWSVLSTSWSEDEVCSLLALEAEARLRRATVVVGVGFSPGLSAVLACHAAGSLDEVDEIHVTRAGTAGPADARRYHRALSQESIDWRDGAWVRRRGGSGRQLSYFSEPTGPRDCYRAGLVDSVLLRRSFPSASRLTARVAATRRDRVTSRLPMLRPPHADGGPGALRVELWGFRGSSREAVVVGAGGSPGDLCAMVVAETASLLADSHRFDAARWWGSWGLSEVVDASALLRRLRAKGAILGQFRGFD